MLAKLSTYGLSAIMHIQSLKETLIGTEKLSEESSKTFVPSNTDLAVGKWEQVFISSESSFASEVYVGMWCATCDCAAEARTIDSEMHTGMTYNDLKISDDYLTTIVTYAEDAMTKYDQVSVMCQKDGAT